MKKVLTIVVLTIMMLSVANCFVQAYDPTQVSGDTTSTGATSVAGLGNKVVGIIQVVGSVAAVGILVVLGIKYMMGSTEEKAEYKKTLIPYIIGAVFIFAASNIAGILFNAASSIS